MKDSKILQKAMKIAIANGYKILVDFSYEMTFIELVIDKGLHYKIIFSHDFAKAFWGKEYRGSSFGIKNWEHNLQQMVIEKEPLKYLEKFILC